MAAYYWTGAQNNYWDNALNWLDDTFNVAASYPQSYYDTAYFDPSYFSSGPSSTVSLSLNTATFFTCGNVAIQNSGGLTVNLNGTYWNLVDGMGSSGTNFSGPTGCVFNLNYGICSNTFSGPVDSTLNVNGGVQVVIYNSATELFNITVANGGYLYIYTGASITESSSFSKSWTITDSNSMITIADQNLLTNLQINIWNGGKFVVSHTEAFGTFGSNNSIQLGHPFYGVTFTLDMNYTIIDWTRYAWAVGGDPSGNIININPSNQPAGLGTNWTVNGYNIPIGSMASICGSNINTDVVTVSSGCSLTMNGPQNIYFELYFDAGGQLIFN